MIRIGTRASKLAMWQANWTAGALRELGEEVEIIQITTKGDVVTGPLHQSGGDGLFTKRIQEALLNKEVDLAVHSLKDLPTVPTDNLTLAAVPKRQDVRDALVSVHYDSVDGLPEGATVGTGSLRRQAQLLNHRPDLKIKDLRGNVDTRLQKLDDGNYDAIILASAGLRRLGLDGRIKEAVSVETLLPAVGQGALGLECRGDDEATLQVVARLNHLETFCCVLAERAFLNETYAGCTAPVGGYAIIDDGELKLRATILSSDGKTKVEEKASLHLLPAESLDNSTLKQIEALGRGLARKMIENGAGRLLDL